MYRYFFKGISVFLVLLIIFFGFFGSYYEAQAALPIVLSPTVAAVIAAILVSAGVVVYQNDDLKGMVYDFWVNASEETKEFINNVANTASQAGTITLRFTDRLYTEVRNFLMRFTVGSYAYYIGNGLLSFNFPGVGNISYNDSKEVFIDGVALGWSYLNFYVPLKTSGGQVYNIRLYYTSEVDPNKTDNNYIFAPKLLLPGFGYVVLNDFIMSSNSIGQQIPFQLRVRINDNGYSVYYGDSLVRDVVGDYVLVGGNASVQYVSGTLQYVDSGTAVVDGYDYDEHDMRNKKLLGWPISLDSYVGKSVSDIGNVVVDSPPEANVETGTVTGWLSTIWATISDFFSLKPIDFSPIRNLPITTKFPFSLPWDVMHLFGVLVAEPRPITFDLSLPFISGESVTVDFGVFDGVMPVIREVVFWGFVISVVFFHRKIVGGAE